MLLLFNNVKILCLNMVFQKNIRNACFAVIKIKTSVHKWIIVSGKQINATVSN